ncbi:MAG TPA: hypothetical protein VMH37_20085 [Candidatus Binataceae bacterium]|nr:hypothetical protein [Candidatus Binataceae bacterium]
MNWLVAGNAAKLIGLNRLHHSHMRWIFSETVRVTMTLQAVHVREGLVECNFVRHSYASIIDEDVPEAFEFGLNRTEEAIVHMTGIALVVKD